MVTALDSLRAGETTTTQLAAHHLNRLYYAARGRGAGFDRGVDVFEQAWDNLILLDACRYDAFAERSTLAGRLESRRSRGSATREWVRANFADRRLHDVVYVSANPNYRKVADEIDAEVHAYVDAWRDDALVADGTVVPPEVVTEAALRAADEYPRKRLLVHYVQPHYPFLGPTGREHFDPTTTVVGAVRRDGVETDLLRRAYAENLDLVLSETERLLAGLEGLSVVSADHGELLGERLFPVPLRAYGHPNGVYVRELVRVPWLIHPGDGRRRIVAEPPVERPSLDGRAVDERLRGLGYLG
jgi:hypothetical protein